jgi:hypothetical protein
MSPMWRPTWTWNLKHSHCLILCHFTLFNARWFYLSREVYWPRSNYGSCQWHGQLDNWGGGGDIFIYLCSALLISFEIDCFYGLWIQIYEYVLPPHLSSWLRHWLLLTECMGKWVGKWVVALSPWWGNHLALDRVR